MFRYHRLAALRRRDCSAERRCAFLGEHGPASGAREFSKQSSVGEVRTMSAGESSAAAMRREPHTSEPRAAPCSRP